jgi:glycosyltransferase involved in cell wall biosynthesis
LTRNPATKKEQAGKIKVLHVITRLIVGGAQENTIDICNYLPADRFEIDLVTGPQIGPEGKVVSDVNQEKIKVTTINELVREISPIKDLVALVKLYLFIKKGKYDVVHLHSSKAGTLGRVAARMAGTPAVVLTTYGWSFNACEPGFKRSFYIYEEKFTAKITDKIIVESDLDSQTGLENRIGWPEKYRTIRSAIKIEEFSDVVVDVRQKIIELGLQPDMRVVGCVSRMSEQKGPHNFVRMAAEVLKENPNVNFIYIGDGPLKESTAALISELGIRDKVVLAGLRKDVPELLKIFDLFVLLSQWEGIPRVFPQAMAAGVPIVATNVGGAPELIKDGVNGYLVPFGDYKTPAKIVLNLLKDENLRKNIGKEGRKSIFPRFTMDFMIEEVEKLYLEILGKAGKRRDNRY